VLVLVLVLVLVACGTTDRQRVEKWKVEKDRHDSSHREIVGPWFWVLCYSLREGEGDRGRGREVINKTASNFNE
jgi:hypothetical protein